MAFQFTYNSQHQVIVCQAYKTCLIPKKASWGYHLRALPHQLSGNILKTTIKLLENYNLKTEDQLQQDKPYSPCNQIQGLELYSGYYCLQDNCFYSTRRLRKMKDHMILHQIKPKTHKDSPLWAECLLQTYFTARGKIDYFRVVNSIEENDLNQPIERSNELEINPIPLTDAERALFSRLEEDTRISQEDILDEATKVQYSKNLRSERIPWLERTGFPSHLAGLRDTEIQSSYRLPSKQQDSNNEENQEIEEDLARLLVGAESLLRDAYDLCDDYSPKRKITQQRAIILNQFYIGASGSSRGFLYKKDPSTLSEYFKIWKQLLAYYYRVVYSKSHQFIATNPEQEPELPQAVIEPTLEQELAIEEIQDALYVDSIENEDIV